MQRLPADASSALSSFSNVFCAFTDLIQDGMKYGTSPGLEGEFSELRQWLLTHYRGVRSELRFYYRETEATPATDWPSSSDSFEQLLKAPTLTALVSCPSKLTIARLADTNDAIKDCLYGKVRTR